MLKLCRLKCFCREKLLRLKAIFCKFRIHFYICFVCIALGFLIAVTKPYGNFTESSNFLASIVNGDFRLFVSLILVGLFTTLAFLAVFCCSIRFICFLIIGYGGLIIGTYFFWKLVFIAIAVDGVLGILYLLLFMLPVFLFDALMIIIALAKIFEICGYAQKKKGCLTGLASNGKLIFNAIKSYWYKCLIFNYVLWLILMLLFLVIF